MSPERVVYLDYAATTPVDPAVAAAMADCLGLAGDFGNPASIHQFGRLAAARVEHARAQVAELIGGAPEEIVFTSGATESANLAILGVARANAHRGRHLVTSRIEHKAVLDPCKHLEKEGFSVTWLTPDCNGVITADQVRDALRKDTVLVSLMQANNEIGVVQDLADIGALCRASGILLHTDAAQSVGKIALDVHKLPVDLVSFTAHKIYGPKGVGALWIRDGVRLWPVSFGGGQERGLRPGTLATHQIVGLGEACALAGRLREDEQARISQLRNRLWSGLQPLGGVHLNGEASARVAGILNVSFEGVEGESLVTGLPQLAVSTGSACNSTSGDPSYVLRALGRDTQLAQSSLRFSLGRFTTAADVDIAIEAVSREVRSLRAMSPAAWQPSSWGEGSTVVSGVAGGLGQGAWIRFDLAVEGTIVKDARLWAFGCPHTRAVASWLAGRLPGRQREVLIPDSPADWARALNVPIEKLGHLFVVEDSLDACLRQWP